MTIDTGNQLNSQDSFFSKKFWLSDVMMVVYVSLLAVILHLIAIEGYGYFRDELYYISCSNHLDLGHVDHPILSILVLKLVRFLLGDSLIAIRILPVLSSGLVVFLTGLIAKELGGNRFAMMLASITALAPIGNFFLFSVYSMNFLDHLFWLVLVLIVLRIIKTGDSRLWIWFGVVAGLGLQNKISVLFLGFGIAVGLLLTPLRKELKSKYLWLGAVLAGVIFLPYILWNMAHDWPMLEFIHNAKTLKMSVVSPLDFFIGQLQYTNYITLIVWLPGLYYFFFSKEGARFRVFGWMYVAIYILFTFQQSKAYYLAPAYPILFAGGAVFIGKFLEQRRWNWPKPLLGVSILVSTLLFAPVCLPILPLDATIQWMKTLGIIVNSGENHKMGVLPQYYADMHGWQEMTVKVARIYNSLSPQEQKTCLIYGTNYGIAGAMNFFGKQYDLPLAISGHNNFFFWPPTKPDVDVLIAVGGKIEGYQPLFKSVEVVDHTDCQYAMPYENNKPIYLCRGLKYPLKDIWPKVKHYE